ncbi:MAG: nickel-dependent lactate racemase, partial [Abditibacteriales bacterium]|nr:nickel-dependent lactate racemase [Abditibacteriales bacterium]
NHHARADEEQQFIGETSNGAPAFIDRTYLQADLKILTGLIEPHLMAGYSGGRKLVCPGIAGWRTIKVFHSPALLEHPRATNGVLDGNPVHQMSLEIARMAGADFILNVTLDEPRRITGVFAGEMETAHLAGVEAVNKMVKVDIGAPADIVVTTSAGYPLDTTFYQAIKGLVGALPAVKQGGTLIMAASLSEGLGSAEFAQLCLQMGSVEAFTQKLLDPDFFVFDQWQAEELVKVLRHCEVMIYSDGVDHDTLRQCLVTPIDSVEDGIRYALDKHGRDARIIVIPEGPYVLPSY